MIFANSLLHQITGYSRLCTPIKDLLHHISKLANFRRTPLTKKRISHLNWLKRWNPHPFGSWDGKFPTLWGKKRMCNFFIHSTFHHGLIFEQNESNLSDSLLASSWLLHPHMSVVITMNQSFSFFDFDVMNNFLNSYYNHI